MTETTINGSDYTTDILMNLVVTLLSPIFLGVCGGDIEHARMAATQTIVAYRATNDAGLIGVAQIIAFGLAALGSLGLSMADDLSLTMILRLRGNANALNRSAEQNRRAVAQIGPVMTKSVMTKPVMTKSVMPKSVVPTPDRASTPGSQATRSVPNNASIQHQAPPTQKAERPCPPPLTDTQRHTMWANAMTNVAREYTASLPHLPPGERKAASFRATVLSSCASHLLAGTPAPAAPPGPSGKASWRDDRRNQIGSTIGSPACTAVSPT